MCAIRPCPRYEGMVLLRYWEISLGSSAYKIVFPCNVFVTEL